MTDEEEGSSDKERGKWMNEFDPWGDGNDLDNKGQQC